MKRNCRRCVRNPLIFRHVSKRRLQRRRAGARRNQTHLEHTLVLRKDVEAKQRLGELRVKTLEELVAHQQAQIAALEG